MTAWRARLSALRGEHTDANSATSANSGARMRVAAPNGAIGPIGTGISGAPQPPGEWIAWASRVAAEAAAALAGREPDEIEAGERAAIAAEAAGAFGPAIPPEDHLAALAGFLDAGLARPPAWSESESIPPPGAWCTCCGRTERRSGRWWRERDRASGWCCRTCHPPDHLPPAAVVEVLT
jgi:hypothetical protein